jgi:hypothetical protein
VVLLLPLAAVLLASAADAPASSEADDVLGLELEAGDSPLWARAGLAARYTWQAALPSSQVLFDGPSQAFAADRYLTPGPAQGFASGLAFVAAGLEATSWLGFRLDVDSGLVRSQNFPATATVCPSAASPSGLAVVGAGTTCTGGARFGLATTVPGPSEITSNGQSFSAEASQTAFIRQLYAEVTTGRAGFLHARLGRQRLRIADGFVYDDWGLGLDVDVDLGALGPPFAVSASVFYPSRAWPTGSDWQYPAVALTADWTPSLGEYLGVWGAWVHDATGDAASILQQGLVENDVAELLATAPGSAAYRATSRRLANVLTAGGAGNSWLGWAGAAGRLELGDASEIRFTAGVSFGSMGAVAATPVGSTAVDVPALGWLLSARYTVQPGGGFTLSPFFIWLTGSAPLTSQRILSGSGEWGGFLAMSPYITATNLFFQGGISESYADRRASGSGVNARGVVAPGIQAGWTPGHGVDVLVKAAWLFADSASSFGGASYGPEVDLNLSWSPWRWLSLLAEADVLAMGNFFPGQGVARKLILGVNVVTP